MSTTSKQRKKNRRNRKSQARDASKNQPKEATQGKKNANRPTLFPLSAERILGFFNEYAEALEAGQLYRAPRIFSVALGVRAAEVLKDYDTPMDRIYDPVNPDANSDGFVEMPNVSATREMADLVTAMRAYEANLKVQENFSQMAERALRLAR